MRHFFLHETWDNSFPKCKKGGEGTDGIIGKRNERSVGNKKTESKTVRGKSRYKTTFADEHDADCRVSDCNCAGIFVHIYLGGNSMSRIRLFWSTLKNDRGIGVVEVILILVVLIGLVIIFKSQLTELVESIFEKITSESSGI